MTHPSSPSFLSPSPPPLANIVLVDDDPSLVDALADMLTSEGYRVEGFTDPTEALARLRHGPPPDLAIVDCIMPHLTGTELRAALADAGVEVPVLLMTALSDPSFCVNPGDRGVLNKPFLLEDLLVEIEHRLRPRSAAPSLRPGAAQA